MNKSTQINKLYFLNLSLPAQKNKTTKIPRFELKFPSGWKSEHCMKR